MSAARKAGQMLPSSASDGQACEAVGESQALLETRRDRRLQAAAGILVCGLVCGTYCYGGLLAAFEQDPLLGWTPRTTSMVNTIGAAAETLGLLLGGPLADHVPASVLLGLEALVVCLTMLAVSLSTSVMLIITVVAVLLVFKGFMWPTVGSTISSNISGTRHDQSFLVAAFGSRAGDICSSLLLGFFMATLAFTWREALGMLMIVVIVLLLVSFLLSPRHLAAPQDKTLSLSGQTEKFKRLVASPEGWLAFVTLSGTYCCWALLLYIAVILQDVYGLSPGRAAASISCVPIGNAFGLAAGVLASDLVGQHRARYFHVLQALLGVASLGMLSIWSSAPFTWALVLLGLAGFGFVVPSYVPYLAYGAGSPSTERAFRLATLDGAASCLSILFVFGYGRLREQGLKEAAPLLYGITCGALLISTVSMIVLYNRLDTCSEHSV